MLKYTTEHTHGGSDKAKVLWRKSRGRPSSLALAYNSGIVKNLGKKQVSYLLTLRRERTHPSSKHPRSLPQPELAAPPILQSSGISQVVPVQDVTGVFS